MRTTGTAPRTRKEEPEETTKLKNERQKARKRQRHGNIYTKHKNKNR